MSETSVLFDYFQENLTFGSGDYLGLLFNEEYEAFNGLNPQEQAKLVGYANGCPVTEQLTDPANTDPGRGPDNMLERYGEVNFWFRQIVHTAENTNAELGADLQGAVQRSEPSGENYEQASVPPTFYGEMSPLGTLWGYAASRLLVKQKGGDDLSEAEAQRRMVDALTILDESVQQAQSPAELLALVAEGVLKTGDVEPRQVLREALSAGWYAEHHASGMVDEVKAALRDKAPDTWTHYESLLAGEKQRAGILDETKAFEAAAGPISIENLAAYHDARFGYTLWENVIDPADPDGPRGIVMHVPRHSMSKTWRLLEPGYSERVEVLRGNGNFVYRRGAIRHLVSSVFKRGRDSGWMVAPLDSEHATADDVELGRGSRFSVVAADDDGVVVFSRPSRKFDISFEQDVTSNPDDRLSRRILAKVRSHRAAA